MIETGNEVRAKEILELNREINQVLNEVNRVAGIVPS